MAVCSTYKWLVYPFYDETVVDIFACPFFLCYGSYLCTVFLCVGAVYAHYCCAVWSENVDQSEGKLKFVDRAVFSGLVQVCQNDMYLLPVPVASSFL